MLNSTSFILRPFGRHYLSWKAADTNSRSRYGRAGSSKVLTAGAL